jgi:hypothetical protein
MKITKLKLILIILSLVLLTKIIITLVALPTPTIDYVAQYNELTKPVNYSPENNAADDYLKAFDLYVEPSEELHDSILMVKWYEKNTPFQADVDPDSLLLLEKWLISNKSALDQIEVAMQKPYTWFEKEPEEGPALGIRSPEISGIRKMSEVMLCSARFNALDNNFRATFDDIIDSYRLGQQQCRENASVLEQYLGINIKTDTIKTALNILSFLEPNSEDLKHFQDSLCSLTVNEDCIPGIETERLFFYDTVQYIYLDWIRGINKPSLRVLYGTRCLCGDVDFLWVSAFVGPSRQKTLQQIDRFFDLHNQLRDKTPWEIYHQYINELREIESFNKRYFFKEFFYHPSVRLFSSFQKSNTQTEALITILAILRYKADNNRFPETLEELLSAGYITYLPKDPYSEGFLKYRVMDDDFVLYSTGKNFEDDKGETVVIEEDSMFGLNRNAPTVIPHSEDQPARIIKRTVYKDLVYWPVTNTPEYNESPKI